MSHKDIETFRINGKIIRNSALCLKCGDEIISTHPQHLATCSCGNISVSGGDKYVRRIGNLNSYKDTSIIERS